MPEEEKKKGPGDIPVDIDTSGPDVDVDIESKDEQEQGTDKTFENERETKLEESSEQKKEEDIKLEDYSKGGRAGFKSGMKVCKLAKRGKGKAYGKNS